jgi:hypothetical protein
LQSLVLFALLLFLVAFLLLAKIDFWTKNISKETWKKFGSFKFLLYLYTIKLTKGNYFKRNLKIIQKKFGYIRKKLYLYTIKLFTQKKLPK